MTDAKKLKFATTATYDLAHQNEITQGKGQLTTYSPDALSAAHEALTHLESLTQPGKVTNLTLQIAIDHNPD